MTGGYESPARTVRRSLKIPAEVDALLLAVARRRRISVNFAFRQAVMLLDYVDTELAKGHRIVLVDDTGQVIAREIVLM